GNGGNDGGNLGNGIIERVMTLIKQDNKVSVQEIADNIGLSKRKCERIIAELKTDGLISRVGSTRSGKWVINDKQ
ncbi:MAG: winged helix-turn-helix transcriptional regulator, partial [Bacteroides sp.]|nr:winged helix-turn-helix transcriptional regulator [Bacteroides sp.]